jgi:hypothetical protein
MENILHTETERRKESLTKEVKLLLSEFSSRPENKGFEAMMEENAVFFAVDVKDALNSFCKKNPPQGNTQH